MPTPSELQREGPRRSVFGNFHAAGDRDRDENAHAFSLTPALSPKEREVASAVGQQSRPAIESPTHPLPAGEGRGEGENPHPTPTAVPCSLDSALARSFLHAFLAKAFEDPEPQNWQWLTSREVGRALRSAVAALAQPALIESAEVLLHQLALCGHEEFSASHMACFGHTVRGDCPMNEIEYGDIKADPLFQPHRLSDLGAFFAAFGLELTPDAAERIDHISIELEFMSVLAAKEAYALENRLDHDALATLRDAQRKFLREHLGRWSPAFARRLGRIADGMILSAVAKVLAHFVAFECARLNVPPGSEDLLLRPVEDAMERLCDTCGLHNLPPGAAMSGAKL